jgi:hypothetical protein
VQNSTFSSQVCFFFFGGSICGQEVAWRHRRPRHSADVNMVLPSRATRLSTHAGGNILSFAYIVTDIIL